MGVTIHYTATLKSPDLLSELCDEIAELSKEAGWKSTHIGPERVKLPNSTEMGVEGTLLNIHEKMEPVNLIFDDTGQMVNFAFLPGFNIWGAEQELQDLQITEIGNDGQVKKVTPYQDIDFQTMSRWASTKTQFAGPGAHICLCKLLNYLDNKYFASIEVRDEGEYWESGELEKLVENMNFINAVLDDLDLYLRMRPSEALNNDDELLDELRSFWIRFK
ncbi:hypothetical protein GWO43_25100 [candidate division KSB1 bacterium]|nr:hypothetical protein [candidate division KSB1 bacterium]NIR68841.1 hypothetical protein [candidate division KSB1 bacterium]NIS27205.1 hypothetical protein [candidate division KSB1 bacterium]NIT74090.1 hypothetical protein [candidate division KSB1 bacterium]NIU27939.1 hypothetical protein [candidate division KSB1 bacterium]